MFSVEVIITWPAAAVAKYCDEYVCLCVCLSARISPESYPRSLPIFVRVAHVRGSVLLRHVDDRPHRLSAGRGWRKCTAPAKCNLRLRLPCCNLLLVRSDSFWSFLSSLITAYHNKQSAITCFKLSHMNRPTYLLIKQKQVLTAYNKAPLAMHARRCSNIGTASKTILTGTLSSSFQMFTPRFFTAWCLYN